jgi:hypothetical protein
VIAIHIDIIILVELVTLGWFSLTKLVGYLKQGTFNHVHWCRFWLVEYLHNSTGAGGTSMVGCMGGVLNYTPNMAFKKRNLEYSYLKSAGITGVRRYGPLRRC